MARVKAAVVATPDQKKMESKILYKTSVIMVGLLTTLAAISGVAMSVMMIVKGLEPLHDPENVHNATLKVGQNSSTEEDDFQESALNILVGILGFFLVALGVPNSMHAVYSIELILGAWQERPKVMLQWVLFNESISAAHAAIVLGLVVGLFWLHRMTLALLMFANFLVLFLISSFFVNIVQMYHAMLVPRVLPDVLYHKNKRDMMDVEAEPEEE